MAKRNIFITIFFITLVVLTRTIFHIGENIEFLTAAGLTTSYFLNRKYATLTMLAGLIISDFVIGNSSVFIFTWTGFLFTPLFASLAKKKTYSLIQKASIIQVSGSITTIIFFLWTNLGVVITTSMYSKNLAGLIDSYINGLPFLYNQLGGNLIIVPTIFLGTHLALNLKLRLELPNINKLKRKYGYSAS